MLRGFVNLHAQVEQAVEEVVEEAVQEAVQEAVAEALARNQVVQPHQPQAVYYNLPYAYNNAYNTYPAAQYQYYQY